jgi:hypothetical protein
MQDDSPYEVSWSRKADEAVTEMGGRYQTATDLTEFMTVLVGIDARLRRDPVNFGEGYRSRGNVEEHLAVLDAVAIDFAVDTRRRFVLVRDCRFLSSRTG